MTPAEELARVKEALGCIIVGLVVSSMCVAQVSSHRRVVEKLTDLFASLYGITILQAFIYYKQNARDLFRVKVLVRARPILPLSP